MVGGWVGVGVGCGVWGEVRGKWVWGSVDDGGDGWGGRGGGRSWHPFAIAPAAMIGHLRLPIVADITCGVCPLSPAHPCTVYCPLRPNWAVTGLVGGKAVPGPATVLKPSWTRHSAEGGPPTPTVKNPEGKTSP